MDDRFMHELRRAPDPAFAEELRERLSHVAAPRAATGRWRPALALAAAAAVVVAMFAFPSMRASAQAMLDLFRVRNFAPVEFDPQRLEKLTAGQHDDNLFLFGTHEVLQDPGKPREVATPEAAAAAAGIDVRKPGDLPRGITLRNIQVDGAAAGRFTANAAKLRAVLQELDIRDLEVPPGLDGASVTVRKSPIVAQRFESDRYHVTLMQSRSPDVQLPAGVDLQRLAEIGMRILGLDRTEANRLARSIDWHTTLMVPVPANASSFRKVEVHGNPGLLVNSRRDGAASDHGAGARRGGDRNGTLILWSEQDRVFALAGNLDDVSMMQMAESVR